MVIFALNGQFSIHINWRVCNRRILNLFNAPGVAFEKSDIRLVKKYFSYLMKGRSVYSVTTQKRGLKS